MVSRLKWIPKKLKVFDHKSNVQPAEITRKSTTVTAMDPVLHHLKWRPDDQVHYRITQQKSTVEDMEIRSRGGGTVILAPLVSAIAALRGMAISLDHIAKVGQALGTVVDGRWEDVAQFLARYIAIRVT